jgi:hypothetical protein
MKLPFRKSTPEMAAELVEAVTEPTEGTVKLNSQVGKLIMGIEAIETIDSLTDPPTNDTQK